MARSSKSLELDIVTTETLFNRGVPLVPDVTAYYPTMSSLSNAAYFTTVWQGQAQTFSNYLYGFSTFDTIYDVIREVSTTNLNASTSIALSVSTIDAYSTSTVAFLINSSNNWGSTPSSFQSNALLFVQLANSNLNFMSNYSTLTAPVLSNQITDSNFFTTNYLPQVGSTIEVSQKYYGTKYLSTQEKYVFAFGDYNNVFGFGSTTSSFWYTQDLLTWNEASLVNTAFERPFTVEWNGSYFLMGGSNPMFTPNQPHMLISYDGISWSTLNTTVYLPAQPNPPFTTSNAFSNFKDTAVTALCWDGTKWIAGLGSNISYPLGVGSNVGMFYSEDAINWYWVTISDFFYSNFRVSKIRKLNSRYYAVGSFTPNYGIILESPDGISWTNQNFVSGSVGPINDITCSGELIFATCSRSLLSPIQTTCVFKNITSPNPDYEIVITNPDDAKKLSFSAMNGVDYHDGRFVIGVTQGVDPLIPNTSTQVSLITTTNLFDIEAWTPLDGPGSNFFNSGIDVLYTGFNWVFGGQNLFPGRNTYVYQSQDGILFGPSVIPSTNLQEFKGFGLKNSKPYQPPPVGNRVITSGVSSIVSTLNTELYASSVLVEYPAILENTSNAWNSIQTQLETDLNSFKNEVIDALPVFKDTGSSISTVWGITLLSTYAAFSTFDYRDETSTFSTLIYRGFERASTLLSQRTVSPFLSTFILGMCTTTEFYNPLLLSSWTDRFTIKEPQSTFMSIALLSLDADAATFETKNSAPVYYTISTLDGTIVAPFLNIVSLSTNVAGSQVISSFAASAFSTFSTNFPFILASTFVYDLNVVNENLSSLSSIFNVTTAGLQSTIDYYNTAVRASSLSSFIVESPSTFNWQYSRDFSTIVNTFSNAWSNTNVGPGVSTLYESTLTLFSTYLSTLSSYQYFIDNEYASSFSGVLYADGQYFSTLTQVGSHLSTFVSCSQFYSTLSTVYKVFSTFHQNSFEYISSHQESGGYFDITLSTTLLASEKARSTLLSSTFTITEIGVLAGYSTSLYSFQLRSTFFTQVRTSTVFGQSTLFTSSLLINDPINTDTELSIQGNMRIDLIPGGPPFIIPSIQFTDFALYGDTSYPITDPRINIAVTPTNYLFNISSVNIEFVPNSIQKCIVGLNITPTIFALDLGFGDARKPVGSLWITSSDERVKTQISTPNSELTWRTIQNLRLVSYNYIDSYIQYYNISHGSNQLGFISQEVSTLFSNVVYEENRFGLSNFQSLDVDQIFLAKVKITQCLLQRLSTITDKVNRLLSEFQQ